MILDILDKEFYIIDCKDFIYFPRIVRVIGFEGGYNTISYRINIKDNLSNRNYREISAYELTRFKTYEEAEKEAKRLNDIPSNKKRAKKWNLHDKYIIKSMEGLWY